MQVAVPKAPGARQQKHKIINLAILPEKLPRT
jgi:hypothetical protein